MNNSQVEIIRFTPENSYEEVLQWQEKAVAEVIAGGAEKIFIGQHAPIYTCGTSFNDADIIDAANIPVVKTGRGGKVTYHGPGQLVVYPILDLTKRGRDLRQYVQTLQQIIIETLAELNINAFTDDEVGVWVKTPAGVAKIAAIGVRVRKWVTFHGLALNVDMDMQPYNNIVPCGIVDKGITSTSLMQNNATISRVEQLLVSKLDKALV